MSSTPSKRIGRPKKSPLEKGGQFSIRLPLLSKLMLEMIAREQNMSLSQAVEYIIKEVSDSYEAREGLGRLLEHTNQGYSDNRTPGYPVSPPSTGKPLGHLTDADRAIAFPASLRNEHEQLFYEVVRDLDYHHSVHVLCDKQEATELFEMCRTAQVTGAKPFQVVEAWLVDHPAPEPPPYVRTAPPSGSSIPKPEKLKK